MNKENNCETDKTAGGNQGNSNASKVQETNDELTFEQKKRIAEQMMAKSVKNKRDNDRYFDFYDDVKDRTRGHEDW